MSLETLQSLIETKASKIDPLGYKVKFVVGEEYLLLDGKGEANTVSSATAETEADTTIKVREKTLNNLLNGKVDPMIAFMSGRIKVDGSMGVALKLQGLFKADE